LNCIDDLPNSYVDDYHIAIGKNVKRIRESKDITQLQLSQALGFKSVGLVSQAELYLKKQHFNIKHLLYIAYILDCNMSDFFEPIKPLDS
jgi:transcriptional regulator with XRE-family HTH domain